MLYQLSYASLNSLHCSPAQPDNACATRQSARAEVRRKIRLYHTANPGVKPRLAPV